MSADERTVVGDYSFPPGAEPDEELLYTIPYGSSKTRDLKWEGYIDVAHNLGAKNVRAEVVDSGHDENNIRYAAILVTVVDEGGNEWSSLGSADQTTNQVRQPEHVWTVAESRATKRAVKKAYNIKPVDASASDEPDAKGPKNKPDDVEFEDGHALADSYDSETSKEDRGTDDTGGVDF